MRGVAFAIIVSLLVATPASAQKFGETVHVDIVEVPVTVVDRDGRSVRGLTKANFELYDEGKRIPIDYFEAIDIAAATAASTGAALPPVTTRNFLLMFDLENSSPGAIVRAQAAAKQFVTDGLAPHDLVAVAVFTAERGAQLLTSFSTDRALIARAIETLGDTRQFRIGDPLMLSVVLPERTSSTIRPKEDLGQVFAEEAVAQNTAAQRANDAELRNRLRVQLNQFGRIAHVLNRLHGQKQVILLSEGFDARLVQGRDDLGSQESKAEIDQILSGRGYSVDTDQRFGNTAASRDVAEMAALFRRADVVLHAIDIAGLRSDSKASNESLSLLTTPTGGTVFKNANDLGANFRRMLKQQEVIYVLGFNAKSTGKPGRFHDLKVKTVEARVSRVSHRPGYFEEPVELTDLEKTLTMAEILTSDIEIEDVPMTLSTSPIPGRDGKARIPVVVEINGPRLLDEITGSTVTASLFLYAFDRQGRVADHLQQRIALDLAQAGDSIRTGGIRYYGTLRVPAGDYAVKAMVRVEETGFIGFTRADVPVPAFDRATVLPPLLFEEPRQWVMLAGAARGDEFPYPYTAGETQYVPRNNPKLQAGGEYKLALFLYRIPVEGLGLEPSVTSRDGSQTHVANVALLGRTAADEHGGTMLLLSFKPEGLKSGEYDLQLAVKTPGGTPSLVSMPFILR